MLVDRGKYGINLKEDIVEKYDFVVVSCEVWKHLYAWYSAD